MHNISVCSLYDKNNHQILKYKYYIKLFVYVAWTERDGTSYNGGMYTDRRMCSKLTQLVDNNTGKQQQSVIKCRESRKYCSKIVQNVPTVKNVQ